MSQRAVYVDETGTVSDSPVPQLLDTTFSPIGLYHFNDSTTFGLDSSGNGRTLTVSGSPGYAPGPLGLAFDQSGTVEYTRSGDAAFQVTTAISVVAHVLLAPGGADRTILEARGPTDSEADNSLYSMFITSSNGFGYFHEYGAGTNLVYTYDGGFSVDYATWVTVGFTRDSAGTLLRFYLNGIQMDSTTLSNAPTGGTSATFGIGKSPAGGTSPFSSAIQAVGVYGSQLSDADMLTLHRRLMGAGAEG